MKKRAVLLLVLLLLLSGCAARMPMHPSWIFSAEKSKLQKAFFLTMPSCGIILHLISNGADSSAPFFVFWEG